MEITVPVATAATITPSVAAAVADEIGMRDVLGIAIRRGDVVRFLRYGEGVRLTDVGATAVVVGVARTRLITDHHNSTRPSPEEVGVVRRDGQPGLEGNRGAGW